MEHSLSSHQDFFLVHLHPFQFTVNISITKQKFVCNLLNFMKNQRSQYLEYCIFFFCLWVFFRAFHPIGVKFENGCTKKYPPKRLPECYQCYLLNRFRLLVIDKIIINETIIILHSFSSMIRDCCICFIITRVPLLKVIIQ